MLQQSTCIKTLQIYCYDSTEIDWDTIIVGGTEHSWNKFKSAVGVGKRYIPLTKAIKETVKPVWMTHKALKVVKKAEGFCSIFSWQ